MSSAGLASLAGCTGSGETEDGGYETTESEPSDSTSTDRKGSASETTTASTISQSTENEETTETTSQQKGSAKVTGSKFKVIEKEYTTEAVVTGTIKNTGSGNLRYVEAKAKFYDKDEALLDTTMVNLLDLGPGEVWEVYAPYVGDASEVDKGELIISDQSSGTLTQPDSLELKSHNLETGEQPLVTGEVKNISGGTLDYVEARVKFYADNGHVLGNGMTNVTDLSADQTWKFEVEFTSYGMERGKRVKKHSVFVTDSAI